jgi:hypothetical protein
MIVGLMPPVSIVPDVELIIKTQKVKTLSAILRANLISATLKVKLITEALKDK